MRSWHPSTYFEARCNVVYQVCVRIPIVTENLFPKDQALVPNQLQDMLGHLAPQFFFLVRKFRGMLRILLEKINPLFCNHRWFSSEVGMDHALDLWVYVLLQTSWVAC